MIAAMSVDVAYPADRPVARPPLGQDSRPDPGRDATVVACTLTWVPLVLVLDRGADVWRQRALGLGTWLLLGWLIRRETPLVRAQVAVVIAFATAVEYTFSPLLEVYVYRLDNVPAFVPPGHGLVYLCALAIGRTAVVQRRRTPLVVVTVLAGAAYAGWGLRSRTGATSSARSGSAACWASCAGAGRSRSTSARSPSSPTSSCSAPGWGPGRGRRTTRPG